MPPTFADLGVPARLCARLDELGIAEPFPVQAATLPDALSGRDVCGKAPTGSGKTIAFGLPLIARIEKANPRRPKGLVLVPTRELASQVQDQLEALCWGTKTEVLAVYGGTGMERQIKALGRGVEVVVATPGRLKDLLDRGSLRLDDVNIVVIDEADRMADMGFLPEVRRLLDKTNAKRQTMLFSATLDGDVDVLVRNYQTNPAHHEAVSLEEQGEVTHRFWSVAQADRIQVATEIVSRSWPAIVFSRTRHGAERLSKQLNKAGVRAEAIHGDRSQSQREFDPPATDKDYVHRSGRTGRAGDAGLVITLVAPEKEKDVRKLQRELRRREPIERATVASVAAILGAAPPKPIDRGDDLDGVSRRERARAADRPRSERPAHRKGTSGAAAKPTSNRRFESNSQGQAATAAKPGRPGASPGRRPAGAGAARPGRPASGNARRRAR